jgi:transcription elongation factor GreA
VHIGSKVTVYDPDLEEHETYEITGTTEANAMLNKISNESPVGKALLGKKVGETVIVQAPEGKYELKIEKID